METEPLITVLIPCYNAMPYLPEALDSIINQTYNNLEILCINDGSNDNTGAVLEEYASKDSRIRVVHNEENLKLIKTLNKGIELAKGEYIARMDADDISHHERIKLLLYFLLQNNYDVVSCAGKYIDNSGGLLKKLPIKAKYSNPCFFMSFFGPPILHAAMLSKKETFRNNNYLESDSVIHTEDYELWTRMVVNNYKMGNINEPLYFVRKNQNSVSAKFENIQIKNFTNCAYGHYTEFFKINPGYNVIRVMVNRLDKSISVKAYLSGFFLINKTKKLFLAQTAALTSDEKKEIRAITAEQKIDILIQSINKGRVLVRLLALHMLPIYLLRALFNNRVRDYITAKI